MQKKRKKSSTINWNNNIFRFFSIFLFNFKAFQTKKKKRKMFWHKKFSRKKFLQKVKFPSMQGQGKGNARSGQDQGKVKGKVKARSSKKGHHCNGKARAKKG